MNLLARDGSGLPTDPGAWGGHFLAKYAVRSGVVLHAVSGRFMQIDKEDVVLAHENTLELLRVEQGVGLQTVHEQPLFGTIKDLKLLPSQVGGKDCLVVLSNSGKLTVVLYAHNRFQALTRIHLSDAGFDHRELGRLLAVEPRARAVAVAAYRDRLALFLAAAPQQHPHLRPKAVVYPGDDARSGHADAGWGVIFSMAFLLPVEDAALRLAVLVCRAGAASADVHVLRCSADQSDARTVLTLDRRITPSLLSPLALISVPHIQDTVLVACPGALLLLPVGTDSTASQPHNLQQVVELEEQFRYTTEDQSTSGALITAWCWESGPGEARRLWLATETGTLHWVTTLEPDTLQTRLALHRPALPTVVPPVAMLVLPNRKLATFADCGDGSLLDLDTPLLEPSPTAEPRRRNDERATGDRASDEQASGERESELSEWRKSTLPSLAPVTHMELVGEDALVACGVGRTASLRRVRRGVGVAAELARASGGFVGVTGLWTLTLQRPRRVLNKQSTNTAPHQLVVVSFVGATRALRVGATLADASDAIGLIATERTLACGAVGAWTLAQVTERWVQVSCVPQWDASQEAERCQAEPHRWTPSHAVSVAAVGWGTVLCWMGAARQLALLSWQRRADGAGSLRELRQLHLAAQLSCISLAPSCDEEGDAHLPPRACVVGTYAPSVVVLSLDPEHLLRPIAVCDLVESAMTGHMERCGGANVPEAVRLSPHRSGKLSVLVGLRNGLLVSVGAPQLGVSDPAPCHRGQAADPGVDRNTPEVECNTPSSQAREAESAVDSRGPREALEPVAHQTQQLQVLSVRRLGERPVALVSLEEPDKEQVLALTDQPWLVQESHGSLRPGCRLVCFGAATHAAPLRVAGGEEGVLLVANESLVLVKLERLKTCLDVAQRRLPGTPTSMTHLPAPGCLAIACQVSRGNPQTRLEDRQLDTPPRQVIDSSAMLADLLRTRLPAVHREVCQLALVDAASGIQRGGAELAPGETALAMCPWELPPAPTWRLEGSPGSEGGSLLVVGTAVTCASARTASWRSGVVGAGQIPKVEQFGRLRVYRVLETADAARSQGPRPPPPEPGSDTEDTASSSQTQHTPPTSANFPEERPPCSGPAPMDCDKDSEASLADTCRAGGTGGGLGLALVESKRMRGGVRAVAVYLRRFLLVAAGNRLLCVSMHGGSGKLMREGCMATRGCVVSLSVHGPQIALGDSRDGVLFLRFRPETRDFEEVWADPRARSVVACSLMDPHSAVAVDASGAFFCLSQPQHRAAGDAPAGATTISPERNLIGGEGFHLGESCSSILRGAHLLQLWSRPAAPSLPAFVVGTILGSLVSFVPLSPQEFELLSLCQRCLASHPAAAPLLGNSHARERRGLHAPASFQRGRVTTPASEKRAGGSLCADPEDPPSRVVDGDLLEQLLHLDETEQARVLGDYMRADQITAALAVVDQCCTMYP